MQLPGLPTRARLFHLIPWFRLWSQRVTFSLTHFLKLCRNASIVNPRMNAETYYFRTLTPNGRRICRPSFHNYLLYHKLVVPSVGPDQRNLSLGLLEIGEQIDFWPHPMLSLWSRKKGNVHGFRQLDFKATVPNIALKPRHTKFCIILIARLELFNKRHFL